MDYLRILKSGIVAMLKEVMRTYMGTSYKPLKGPPLKAAGVAAIVLIIILLILPNEAFASTSRIIYEGQGVFSFQVVQSSNGKPDLFANFKNIMPGDTLTQDIAIENQSSCKSIAVYVSPVLQEAVGQQNLVGQQGASAGQTQMLGQQRQTTTTFNSETQAFLEALDLEVYQDDTCISWGNNLAQGAYLGSVDQGKSADLRVVLQAPADIGNEFQLAWGAVDWLITVQELDEFAEEFGDASGADDSANAGALDKNDPAGLNVPTNAKDPQSFFATLPKTGDETMAVLWLILMIVSFSTLLVIKFRSRGY